MRRAPRTIRGSAVNTPSTSVYISQQSAPRAAARATAVVSEPPRPSVVMSLLSCETPWNPATIGIAPSSSAPAIRPGVTSMIRARPCTESVITPACEPVNERARSPRLAMAMASRAIEMRSPAVSSMSSSRPGGSGLTWLARSISSSVVSPIADTTTTTSWPAFLVATIRCATRLMPSASATDDPPYFCTTRDTGVAPPLLHDNGHGGVAPPGRPAV